MKKYILLLGCSLLSASLLAQSPTRKKSTAMKKTTSTAKPAALPANSPSKQTVAAPAPVDTQATVSKPAQPTPVQTGNIRLARTPIRVGLLAGATFASIRLTDGSELLTSPTKTGLHLGLLADIPLGDHWSIQPNLLYVAKGWGESADGDFRATSLNYLELPVTINYLIPTGAGLVRLGAGPYVGYGLSITTTAKNSDELKFGTDRNDVNPLDYGGRVSAQLQLSNGFLVGAAYSIGMANLNNSSSDGAITNRVFGFSAGYVFGNKR